MNIEAVNRLAQDSFTALFGDVFEHSSWIAAQAWARHPFQDLDALHGAMVSVLDRADDEVKLKLLRAHPELAGKAAREGELTDASASEQSGAKLDTLTESQVEKIDQLNKAYREKFGFPFIVAVRDHSRDGIFQQFEQRLDNAIDDEFATAVAQVARIGRFRLEDIVES